MSVDAAIEARLTFPLPFRYTRVINRAFGYDEIPIGANGVKTDFDTLMAHIMAYWQAWRGQHAHRHRPPPH